MQRLEVDDVSPFQGLRTQNLENVLHSCIKCVHSISEWGTSKFLRAVAGMDLCWLKIKYFSHYCSGSSFGS